MVKKYFSIIIFILISNLSLGQDIIDVSESTIKISSFDEHIFYCGFAEGDKMIFNFEELNGKELKEIEIIEMPTSSKFTDYKSVKISEKVINIQKKGIYKFRFYNSSLAKRICKIRIQRIAASDLTKKFDTNVYWKTISDTTYTPKVERYIDRSEKIANEIYNANPQISSSNALNGNRNRQIVEFDLPSNTIAWSFYIGTGSAGKSAFDSAKSKFSESVQSDVSALATYNPMAALALTGVSYFSKTQGEDNVKYWFLSDQNSVTLFNTGQQFYTYKSGDVITEASQMKTPLNGRVYLALLNDNTFEPISLMIRVTAIQQIDHWKERTVQLMKVSERQEPYLMN